MAKRASPEVKHAFENAVGQDAYSEEINEYFSELFKTSQERRLQEMQRRVPPPTTPSRPSPPYHCGERARYTLVNMRGWKICLERQMASKRGSRTLRDRTFKQLKGDFKKLKGVLKPDVYNFLKKNVKIFIEDKAKNPKWDAVYHPSPVWLKNNGFPEYLEKSIQVAGQAYLENTKPGGIPTILLHELSHAWHHQKLGYDYQPLKDAYNRAKASGKYQRVKHINGSVEKAYGMNNEQEFFAELTEAFFWINDF